jgi:hypothetical protein
MESRLHPRLRRLQRSPCLQTRARPDECFARGNQTKLLAPTFLKFSFAFSNSLSLPLLHPSPLPSLLFSHFPRMTGSLSETLLHSEKQSPGRRAETNHQRLCISTFRRSVLHRQLGLRISKVYHWRSMQGSIPRVGEGRSRCVSATIHC